MANFKTCENGHNFNADLYQECPFCPPSNSIKDYDKTLMDFKSTQIIDDGNNQQFVKTSVSDNAIDLKKTPVSGSGSHPLKRTSIEGMSNNVAAQSEKRKLVGWLVTFSHDEFGQDYKLFAGKNKIGSSAGGDIIINDPSVSSEHTTILFRDNSFLIKDHFSTNGTKINGVIVDEGNLKEGDELRLGNTIFKFKTVN